MKKETISKKPLDKKEKKVEVKEKKISKFKLKKNKPVAQEQKVVQEVKRPHVSKRQFGRDSKKATLVVKGRQTRWAPVWAVMKKYGTGKRVHPSAMTAYKRNWRRTKLHIKPRRIKKWHLG
jgi:ribosomal protein L39E